MSSSPVEINLFAFGLNNGFEPEATSVCGGRRFKRVFSKKDFPLLGQDEDGEREKEYISLSARSKALIPKSLSVSVKSVRDRYRDPETGKWRWPQNGADLVYPGIFLGDA